MKLLAVSALVTVMTVLLAAPAAAQLAPANDAGVTMGHVLGIALAFLTDPSGVYIELTEGLDKY